MIHVNDWDHQPFHFTVIPRATGVDLVRNPRRHHASARKSLQRTLWTSRAVSQERSQPILV